MIEKIETNDAPQALGPYSQAVKANNMIFVSGQIPIDPATGKMVAANIEAQTRQVLHNMQAILQAAGLSLEQVIRSDIFMLDLNDFQAMNNIYSEFFSFPVKPARQTIQVARLPLDALIEISCIAVLS
jgi:2-iminobutanoate/2-iminopropanoate deaminase